jgi:ParB family chromosome partitioning protein
LTHGGDRVSEQAANLPVATQAEAAEMLNVSTRTVTAASKVRQDAPESVVHAVEAGLVSVSLAAKVASLPEEEKQTAAAAVTAEPEKAREVLREAVRAHVANNSGNNEWYTPPMFVEAARAVMGSIDTDPASSEVANRTVKAGQYFDAAANGLSQAWAGNVWMNPPYAQPLIAEFAGALCRKYKAKEIAQACVLVNNGTETGWFQTLLDVASAVCLVKTRIKFLDMEGKPSGAPLQGQAIIYVGDNPTGFAEGFVDFGKVLYA